MSKTKTPTYYSQWHQVIFCHNKYCIILCNSLTHAPLYVCHTNVRTRSESKSILDYSSVEFPHRGLEPPLSRAYLPTFTFSWRIPPFSTGPPQTGTRLRSCGPLLPGHRYKLTILHNRGYISWDVLFKLLFQVIMNFALITRKENRYLDIFGSNFYLYF